MKMPKICKLPKIRKLERFLQVKLIQYVFYFRSIYVLGCTHMGGGMVFVSGGCLGWQ